MVPEIPEEKQEELHPALQVVKEICDKFEDELMERKREQLRAKNRQRNKEAAFLVALSLAGCMLAIALVWQLYQSFTDVVTFLITLSSIG